eukprot:CAMPEP_0170219118 /NCGR_PEP_ID=MMETSP0116_2-20130129/9233_1 /TAXON_ID=400756 /ORGANISM="Durinskia baltica, Strain CSIRO CS-38" /LENGTH=162 /DNA_ID=CAMNT_0010469769 /DNA_START=222 /DNA_END=710 /DNA_ORIENTATION=-
MTMKSLMFLALNIFVLLSTGTPFSISHNRGTCKIGSSSIHGKYVSDLRPTTMVHSSPNDDEKEDGSAANSSASSSGGNQVEEKPYPIDLPSPILLATSMVLAIVGTGSAFDLGGGSPSLGFGTTAAIAAITIPLCLFLFYASILKATAETEADDKEFMKGKY